MAFLRRKLAAYRLFSVWVVTLDAKVFLKEDPVAKKNRLFRDWFIIIWRLAVTLFLMWAQSGLCSSFVGQNKQTHNTL